MPHQLKIRTADINDAGLLTALGITIFRAAFGPDNRQEDMDKYIAEEMNQDRITAELADKTNIFFIVRIDDEAIGYAKMRTRHNPEAPKSNKPIEIERLYVLHDYHGRQVGAALMEHCINVARQQGCDAIWLGVWEQNHRAVKFYKKWGFELYGSHNFKLGDDIQTDVLMKLRL